MHRKVITKLAAVATVFAFLVAVFEPIITKGPQVTKAENTDINTYILQQNFPNPDIQTRNTPFFGVGSGYRNGIGKPEGIIVHETANSRSTIENEIRYQCNNWNVPGRQAYVHAFVDHAQIINTANTDLTCWGAGPVGNSRYISIELCREKTYDNFARSINNDAYYVAYLLKKYNLPVTNATHTGNGTVWSHDAVSRFLGGTDHSDPVGYFNSWGYSMDQFVNLVKYKYDNIGVNKAQTIEKVANKADILETNTVTGKASNQQFYYLTDNGIVNGGSANNLIGNAYRSTSIVKTQNNNVYTLLSNDQGPFAWIRTDQLFLNSTDPVVSTTNVANIAYLTDNSALYYLLDTGFQANDISGPYSYSIRSIAKTASGRIYYLLNDNFTGEPFMWVESKSASLKDKLSSEIVSTIKGSAAIPDKKGARLPRVVDVQVASPTAWLLDTGLTNNGYQTYAGTQLFNLGSKVINGTQFSEVSFDGFDTLGYVPSSTLTAKNDSTIEVISKQEGIAVINKAQGAQVYSSPDGKTDQMITNNILPNGSAWKFISIVTTNDQTEWYQVGSYQWIKGSDINIKY